MKKPLTQYVCKKGCTWNATVYACDCDVYLNVYWMFTENVYLNVYWKSFIQPTTYMWGWNIEKFNKN